MRNEIYRGWLIEPVFVFSDGKADYQIFPDEGKEQGYMHPKDTLEGVKSRIDEYESEQTFI